MPRAATLSLIGMPGAGKSTVGQLLAQRTGLEFVDSDRLIEAQAGATLQEIVDRDGFLALRALDEQVILDLSLEGQVVATGGSVIYSTPALQRLQAAGPLIWLQVSLATLEARIAAAPPRGIANQRGADLAEVFAERHPRYAAAADLAVDTTGLPPEAVVKRILAWLDTSRTRSPL